jgi:hypothetical protein
LRHTLSLFLGADPSEEFAVVADSHSPSTTYASSPPVAWITRQLNDACRPSGKPSPASELCGEVAEFMGILDDDAD